MLLAEHLEQMADLKRFTRIADKKLTVFGNRALMDPKHRQLADKRVDIDFKDVANRMRLGVWNRPEFFRLRPFAFEKWFRITLSRIGQQSRAEIQQFFDSRPGPGGDKTDG